MSQSGQDFGANDWLVEEMYERYQADPSSVPAEWVTYFQNNPQVGASSAKPSAGVPPTPMPVSEPNISIASARVPASPTTADVASPNISNAPAAPVVAQPSSSVPTQNWATSTPATPVVPAAPAAPVQTQPIVREVAAAPSTPAQAEVKPAPTLAAPSASTMEPLRGVAGRVVQSMEASLTVPTATSVRAIPAKLMIDNRIVINLSLIHI